MSVRRHVGGFLFGLLVLAIAIAPYHGASSDSTGEARLVAFEPLPAYADETCEWEVALPQTPSYADARAVAVQAQIPDSGARLDVAGRAPMRYIKDPYPAFSSIFNCILLCACRTLVLLRGR